MKQTYLSPELSVMHFSDEDVLTSSSGDNDAPFMPPTSNSQDEGWSGYH